MAKSKNRDELRASMETAVRTHDIPVSDFRPLGVHEDWHKIEANIYHTFCKLDDPTGRPVWLWEYFKLDTAYLPSIAFPYVLLTRLIDPSEEIWFFVNGDFDKFRFYQGKIAAIRKIIAESVGIDELYLASKKCEWLVCINHHDTLIATGEVMAGKLRNLSAE